MDAAVGNPIDPAQADFLAELEPGFIATLGPDDIYANATAETLMRLREDKRLERKPQGAQVALLAEYYSMWANTAPNGGLIVVGQEDAKKGGALQGLEQRGDWINELEKSPDRLCGDAEIKHRRINFRNERGREDFVVLMRVEYHKTKVVRTNKGEAYTRWGDECHHLSELEIRELEATKGQLHPELEDCSLRYPDGFDEIEIATFAARVRKGRRLPPTLSDETVLADTMRLGRMTEDGSFVPNVACALLFAINAGDVVPGSKLKFQRFDGITQHTGSKYNAVRTDDVFGTVPELIAGASDIIAGQVREFSYLDDNGKFYTSPEYPPDVWLEAVVNACAHRSYGNGLHNSNIFVRMFDDRLEIESPGPFPPLVTPERLFHNPKNPKLMEALYHLEHVRCANEGTRRMKELMHEMSLPAPEFSQHSAGGATVLVTLRNNFAGRRRWVDHDIETIVGQVVADALTEAERQCLNFMAINDDMSVTDGQKVTGRAWETVKKVLAGLEDRGIVERHARGDIKRDPKARYRIKRAQVAPVTDGSPED